MVLMSEESEQVAIYQFSDCSRAQELIKKLTVLNFAKKTIKKITQERELLWSQPLNRRRMVQNG